jgi:hypothetical protein
MLMVVLRLSTFESKRPLEMEVPAGSATKLPYICDGFLTIPVGYVSLR